MKRRLMEAKERRQSLTLDEGVEKLRNAADDLWADPKGEFLAGMGADPVYRLLTGEGVDVTELPRVDQPVHSRIGYQVRSGGHNLTGFDWEQYSAFADKFLPMAS